MSDSRDGGTSPVPPSMRPGVSEPTPATGARPAVPPALVLLVALAGISAAAPLVRLSASHPLAIATWRLGLSVAVIAGVLLVQGSWRQWRTLARGDVLLGAAAGVLLALHFWSWMVSLTLTTIAASVVLVSLQPAFVALGSALWLAERPDSRQLGGIGLAIAGAAVIALGDATGGGSAGSRALLGDLLALCGAATAAGYYLVGRRLRQQLDLWPYVGLVYGVCFLTLTVLCIALGVPLGGYAPRELTIFAALALGPMLLGHTGMNWALRYLPAYVVNLTVLGEPIGATALAALLPGIAERPSSETLAGGTLVMIGVLAAAWQRGRRAPAAGAPAGPPT